jgi:hypothetical protein
MKKIAFFNFFIKKHLHISKNLIKEKNDTTERLNKNV